MSVHEPLVRVCVNGECVQRSVSSCRAWNGRERRAVSAPHPKSPLETNPSYRDEPPLCFAFPRPRFPLYPPLRSLSLALFPRRPVQPSVSLRAKPRRRKPNGTGGKKGASLKNRGSMNDEILPALKSQISLHISYYHYKWYRLRGFRNLSKDRISVDGTFFR